MGELTRRVPSRWNYDAAVRRVRGKVFKWKRATADLVREVWIAHEVLTRPGARGDLVPNRTRSWAGFLEDVGLGRTTAWRWLQQYDAQEHKLLEGEARTPAKRDPVVRGRAARWVPRPTAHGGPDPRGQIGGLAISKGIC
ncbi:MAG: hypothetical protein FJX72_13535 [Armatimonadetes bacterium]|nr:hypothetical protein [Armatimonadota bacterium]